jgi:hypothetical protein
MGDRDHIVVLEGHIAVIADLVERLRAAAANEDYLELTDVLDELDEELTRAGDNIRIRREASS